MSDTNDRCLISFSLDPVYRLVTESRKTRSLPAINYQCSSKCSRVLLYLSFGANPYVCGSSPSHPYTTDFPSRFLCPYTCSYSMTTLFSALWHSKPLLHLPLILIISSPFTSYHHSYTQVSMKDILHSRCSTARPDLVEGGSGEGWTSKNARARPKLACHARFVNHVDGVHGLSSNYVCPAFQLRFP